MTKKKFCKISTHLIVMQLEIFFLFVIVNKARLSRLNHAVIVQFQMDFEVRFYSTYADLLATFYHK
jgi:hypothetical protein